MFKIKTDHDNHMIRFLFIAIMISIQTASAYEFMSEEFKKEHVTPFLNKATDSTSIGIFLSGAATSFATRDNDDQVRSEWKDHQKIHKSDSHIGDILGTGAGSLLVMAGQYYLDDNRDNFKSHARGFVYGGLSIYTLKTAFGRNRPGNSDSHQSFPSGHSAISFMTATNVAYAYGWPAGFVAYTAAGFVGATRLSDDAHWFSDIVGGAFLGVLVGRASYYSSSDEKDDSVAKYLWNDQYQFIPVVSHDQVGASLNLSFN